MRANNKQRTLDDRGGCRPGLLLACLAVLLLLLPLTGCGPQKQTVTLALLGDINLGRAVNPTAQSFSYLASELDHASLALANLESPLADVPEAEPTGYNLCTPAGRAGLLPVWGLDLVSITNNHNSDCGEYGSLKNIAAVEAAGLIPIWENSEPLYRYVKTMKLAFLGLDDVSAPVDAEAAGKSIQSAREEGAVVIVSIHWGMEYQSGASERQESLARQLAEAGAAVIWGHHPHVLQPVEWLQTTHGKTLVLYSLGNALFDQGALADTRRSALAMVELDSQGAQSVRAVPFVIDASHGRVAAPDEAARRKILEDLKIE